MTRRNLHHHGENPLKGIKESNQEDSGEKKDGGLSQKTRNIFHKDASKFTYDYEKFDVINDETSDDRENQGMGFL